MDFVAIDVETSNADMASICQIGIAKYADGVLIKEWVSLIDPEDYFDFVTIDIHGIDEVKVDGSPTFPEVIEKLQYFLERSVCVPYTF